MIFSLHFLAICPIIIHMSQDILRPTPDQEPIGGWKKELEDEKFYYAKPFVYRVDKNPQALFAGVTAAVFYTMVDYNLKPGVTFDDVMRARDAGDFSNIIKSAKSEISATESIEDCLTEALDKGMKATQIVFSPDWESRYWGKYTAEYEYNFRFGKGIKFEITESTDPNIMLISAQTPEIFGVKGLPETILSREERVEGRRRQWSDDAEEALDAYRRFQTIGDKLGIKQEDPEAVLLNLYIGSGIPRLQDEIWGCETWEEKKAKARELSQTLTSEEREILTQPQMQVIRSSFSREIAVGNQKGMAKIKESFVGIFTYDPDTHALLHNKGEKDETSLRFTVQPEITSLSTHQSVLALRKAALALTQEIGL